MKFKSPEYVISTTNQNPSYSMQIQVCDKYCKWTIDGKTYLSENEE